MFLNRNLNSKRKSKSKSKSKSKDNSKRKDKSKNKRKREDKPFNQTKRLYTQAELNRLPSIPLTQSVLNQINAHGVHGNTDTGNILIQNRINPHEYGENNVTNMPPNWISINTHMARREGGNRGMAAEIREPPKRDEIYDRINKRFDSDIDIDIVSYIQRALWTTDTEETLSGIITFLKQQYPHFKVHGTDREILEQYISATDKELTCEPLPSVPLKKSWCSMMGGYYSKDIVFK